MGMHICIHAIYSTASLDESYMIRPTLNWYAAGLVHDAHKTIGMIGVTVPVKVAQHMQAAACVA